MPKYISGRQPFGPLHVSSSAGSPQLHRIRRWQWPLVALVRLPGKEDVASIFQMNKDFPSIWGRYTNYIDIYYLATEYILLYITACDFQSFTGAYFLCQTGLDVHVWKILKHIVPNFQSPQFSGVSERQFQHPSALASAAEL